MRFTYSMKAAGAASIALLAFGPGSTHLQAHGFEGDRFFPPTIQTEDPFAVDELSLPVVSFFNNPAGGGDPKTRELDIRAEFDKEILPKFALGLSAAYIILKPQGEPSRNGFDNFSVSAKYQVSENAPHEFIVSVGGEVDLGGTGSKSVGREPFSTFTPTIYFGKGFNDLPASLNFFKPFALTGTLGYVIPGESANSKALNWGLALEYSLPYLQQSVREIEWLRPLKNVIPLVELAMNSPLDRGLSTGTINPGLLWESRRCQIGAEAVIPINRATGLNVGFVVQVQIFIDDLLPQIFGHPLFFAGKPNALSPQ